MLFALIEINICRELVMQGECISTPHFRCTQREPSS
jgi:hypothetical protein